MSRGYQPSNVVTRAIADSRPQHVARNMFGTARRKQIRYRTIKWIQKAKHVLKG